MERWLRIKSNLNLACAARTLELVSLCVDSWFINPVKLPLILIFMGVAGSGKTTVASLFAKKTGAAFYEGDEFHPPANIEKMRRGIPLTDDDRKKWLRELRKIIARAIAKNEFAVMTCSALKATYRAQLQDRDVCVKFVHLTASPATIEQRLKNRRGHFMPPSLLASQFAILEPPADAMTFTGRQSPRKIVAALIQTLGIVPIT